MVCGKEAQYSEIIATSANQIVPPKFRGPTKMLYYIHQTPFSYSYCSVEGGSGDETRLHVVAWLLITLVPVQGSMLLHGH